MKKNLLISLFEKDRSNQVIPRNITRALHYINENLRGPLNLDEISNTANLSKGHFSRIFKKITGLSPFNYIIAIRMERASKLLNSTNLNVTEICYQIGYESLSYFCETFKKWTGLYPMEYRAKYYVTQENDEYFCDLTNLKKANSM